jgi:hypothetical protein
MKSKIWLLIITLTAFCTWAGCSKHVDNVDLKNVKSIVVIPAHAGANDKTLPLHLDQPHDQAVAENIINWLNTSTVTNDGKGQFFSFGGSPTIISITLQDGNTIEIQPAIGSTSKKVPNGTEVQSKDMPDQVYVSQSRDGSRFYVKAPQLKTWLVHPDVYEESSFTVKSAIAKLKSTYIIDSPDTPDKWEQVYRNIGGKYPGITVPMQVETQVKQVDKDTYIITLYDKWNASDFHYPDQTNSVLSHQESYQVTPLSVTKLIESGDTEPSIP